VGRFEGHFDIWGLFSMIFGIGGLLIYSLYLEIIQETG